MAPHQIQPASPLPWKLFNADDVMDANGNGVADTASFLNAEANARYIVTACNLFPELVEALKGLLGDIESGLLVRDITRDGAPAWPRLMLDFVQRLQRAQAVLAKAERS